MPRSDTFPYIFSFVALGIQSAWQYVFGNPELGLTGAIAAGFALRCSFMARTINAARAEPAKVRRG
ncbi:hypothetical protein HII36_54100 [Nonomuraea sp. NN258]|uniref:hypothetical protein n=1 Tax=Nonomuraea antri TaxID=2730852 RepID=UPI0015696347|nr:hypothetical protein [Nonomuraea antri]NRQ40689.1 hypothetical protein [Nonomuraea antri]